MDVLPTHLQFKDSPWDPDNLLIDSDQFQDPVCTETACGKLWSLNHGLYEGVSKSFRNHPKVKEPEMSFLF